MVYGRAQGGRGHLREWRGVAWREIDEMPGLMLFHLGGARGRVVRDSAETRLLKICCAAMSGCADDLLLHPLPPTRIPFDKRKSVGGEFFIFPPSI